VLTGTEGYVSPLKPSVNIMADGEVGEKDWVQGRVERGNLPNGTFPDVVKVIA